MSEEDQVYGSKVLDLGDESDEESDIGSEENNENSAGSGEKPQEPKKELTKVQQMLQARKDKLFQLQLKMNESRVMNREDAKGEAKQSKMTSQELRKLDRQRDWDKKAEAKQERITKAGEDNEFLNETVTKCVQREEKKKTREKRKASFGWEAFNQDNLYRAYKKRLSDVTVDSKEYAQMKASSGDDFYRSSRSLEYGRAHKPSEENLERMVGELSKQAQKKANFSRRRAFNEDENVDYITERNRVFNKKVERAFGQYTVEIKQNLERGTAL